MRLCFKMFVFICVFSHCVVWLASARTFSVNAVRDVNDLSPGNGLCVAYLIINPPFVLPFCSVRAAIEEANALPGPDVIELPSTTIRLEIEGSEEDAARTGDLDITESLTITGKGPGKTVIDGRGIDRVLDITAEGATVTLKNLTVLNGGLAGFSSGAPNGGGVVKNRGSLRLENVMLLNTFTSDQENAEFGGLLFNSGYCWIINSTLQGGRAYQGGGIYNATSAEVVIVSSTISDNDGVVGAGGANYGKLRLKNVTISGNGSSRTVSGGALENKGEAALIHTTIAFNRATRGGGISTTGLLYLQNTIVGNNLDADCNGVRYIFSEGHNLASDDSCGLTGATDFVAVNPGLRALRNNGGMTMTHALYPLSPGRDRGRLLDDSRVDQRGVMRPQGEGVDIGAVENHEFALPPLVLPIILP